MTTAHLVTCYRHAESCYRHAASCYLLQACYRLQAWALIEELLECRDSDNDKREKDDKRVELALKAFYAADKKRDKESIAEKVAQWKRDNRAKRNAETASAKAAKKQDISN